MPKHLLFFFYQSVVVSYLILHLVGIYLCQRANVYYHQHWEVGWKLQEQTSWRKEQKREICWAELLRKEHSMWKRVVCNTWTWNIMFFWLFISTCNPIPASSLKARPSAIVEYMLFKWRLASCLLPCLPAMWKVFVVFGH